MWLSNRAKREETDEGPVQVGTVTIGGTPAGVYLVGEHRNVELYAPGGYHWMPSRQDAVMVVKSGVEGAPGIVGRKSESTRTLKAGEVWISAASGSGIYLRSDGVVDLIGDFRLNGLPMTVSTGEE